MYLECFCMQEPRTDEPIQPDNRYKLSGNTIWVRTLDLNQDFDSIAKELDTIVSGELE